MAPASRLRSWLGSDPSAPLPMAAGNARVAASESPRVAPAGVVAASGGGHAGVGRHHDAVGEMSRMDRGRPVRLSTQDHARALLAWLQADPDCQGLMTAGEIRALYDDMVVSMNILPRGWGGVSRELTRLLDQPKLRIEEGGRRPRAFNIVRPGDALPIDRIVAAAAVIGRPAQALGVA
jgi:hypothetical protein